MKTDNGYATGSKRLLLEAICMVGFIALILLSTATYAQSIYCDGCGNCTGTDINTYSDSFGNTLCR